ncbi:molecular chaperone DnaJ [Rhodococcus sp. 05-340-1]|uniref:DnaJ family domain-containing protein n=1 Tax=unclassified Rhodococcus (in: high G+C Gram-positive bacteria) TaxID=192944 RepID=UPI000B9AE011|nr:MULTISPECIES: DUF1992 domain-containing protein [unclassified Rhodococcus (in: high G+C Gram-positive bacteria)]OZD68767.1 molecular chaperone DnaJ [Rhodococcus sp. 05-340-2]OZD70346.1 molecular chaperone DnaJ [Rhodococcus sp. 05-340-1]
MTERKKPGVTFESWVDKQIREAQDNGAFEGLEGTGKPIPVGDPGDELWWVRGYLKRENLPADALLPTALQLRKEIERLPSTLIGIRREDSARDVLDELNARIVDWIRFPTPPVVPLAPVDVETWMESWRTNRAEVDRLEREHRSRSAEPPTAGLDTAGASWWTRVRRTFTRRR